MIIRLEGALYKTDPWVADIFTDILNAAGSCCACAGRATVPTRAGISGGDSTETVSGCNSA